MPFFGRKNKENAAQPAAAAAAAAASKESGAKAKSSNRPLDTKDLGDLGRIRNHLNNMVVRISRQNGALSFTTQPGPTSRTTDAAIVPPPGHAHSLMRLRVSLAKVQQVQGNGQTEAKWALVLKINPAEEATFRLGLYFTGNAAVDYTQRASRVAWIPEDMVTVPSGDIFGSLMMDWNDTLISSREDLLNNVTFRFVQAYPLGDALSPSSDTVYNIIPGAGFLNAAPNNLIIQSPQALQWNMDVIDGPRLRARRNLAFLASCCAGTVSGEMIVHCQGEQNSIFQLNNDDDVHTYVPGYGGEAGYCEDWMRGSYCKDPKNARTADCMNYMRCHPDMNEPQPGMARPPPPPTEGECAAPAPAAAEGVLPVSMADGCEQGYGYAHSYGSGSSYRDLEAKVAAEAAAGAASHAARDISVRQNDVNGWWVLWIILIVLGAFFLLLLFIWLIRAASR